MGEGSNEMDENGNGIRVVATYQVAIGKDVQRQVQMRTMSPAQYFFSFDQDVSITNLIDSQKLKDSGISDNVKLVNFPISKNEVLFRFENIGENQTPREVDINKVIQAYGGEGCNIQELSLTGNMPIEEMKQRKI